ncbi:transcriptional regulator [Paenibacillus sp. BIHB 4019]|uniref:Transcriptional regulator n=1 Tax=Paenibacillus sp. BIHB 4019 TaxID=1870819 RepID=A0A1B2DSH3_9BACL|nr:YafY family protein [Paenibacillus sp. BIHB 4019]ANY70662.1 transcriptional regulator [Paenibacillus sp. BIHB 4019]
MNKTERLLAILLELQRKDMMRAEDLAAVFETSVRTIYRDMQALSESGVPIIGEPGVGYTLMEGYFLPPISFTVEEAVTLLIGTVFVEQQFDEGYTSKARVARGKIEAILPERVREEADRTRAAIKLLAPYDPLAGGLDKQKINILRTAILEQRKIRLHYKKTYADEDGSRHSTRIVAPYGLVFSQGNWLLLAYCELRASLRHFRLSRMEQLALLDERFRRPQDFDLQAYVPENDRKLPVRIWVNPSIADKVKEQNNFYMESFEENEDGLYVNFLVRVQEELLHWILGWGSGVVVLEPESLRLRVRAEAVKILESY